MNFFIHTIYLKFLQLYFFCGCDGSEWLNVNIMTPIYFTQVLILAMLLLGAWKYKKLKHPATFLALGVNLFIFLLEPIGRSTAMQHFFKALLKG